MVEDVANQAGGDLDWRTDARLPSARACDRLLLEFVTYLKGDSVGALEDSDIEVLARTVLAEERIERLLERAAEQLDDNWDDEVGTDDWVTPSGMAIFYVALDPPENSWPHARREGAFYVFVSEAEWSDERSIGEPTLYAGAGWAANREERAALAGSGWPDNIEAKGFRVLATPTATTSLGLDR